jgi:ribonuclease Z
VIRLDQVHVPWRELTDVFLTHLHADHTFALPDVFLMGWILGRTDPFEVRGPSGTRDMCTSMVHALDVDIASRVMNGRLTPKTSVTEITPGVVYQRDGIKVTAFDVDHTVKPAFGYRIDVDGRSVVLSGDTQYSENLIRKPQGVDMLVHEVVFGSPGLTPPRSFVG